MRRKNYSNVQLAWALHHGLMKYIDEVKNGLKCDCVCPQCGTELIARNNCKKKANHFAHATDVKCLGAAESALHLISKEIICNSTQIALPLIKIDEYNKSSIPNFLLEKYEKLSGKLIDIKYSEREITVRNFRPDVVIHADEDEVFVEIVVTNETKDSKIEDFQNHQDLLFQIDLSEEGCFYLNREELTEKLLYEQSLSVRRWLYKRIKKKTGYIESYKNYSNPDEINYDYYKETKQQVPTNSYSNTQAIQQSNYSFNNEQPFSDQFKKYLKDFTPNQQEKLKRFVSDINILNDATSKDWREKRIQSLREQSAETIGMIHKQIELKQFSIKYLAPRISNVWILNVHSDVWQYKLIKKFVPKDGIIPDLNINRVNDWIKKEFSLFEPVYRLSNSKRYGLANDRKTRSLMDNIRSFKKEFPFEPDHLSLLLRYFDCLTEKGILKKKKHTIYQILE